MSDLILRAEQGVLGALLTDPDHAPLTALTAGDFVHPTHQAIYSAIRDLQPLGYEPGRLADAVAAIVDRPDVDTAWLRELADTAPDRDRAKAYARIVVQAAFDRDTADFAQPYLDAAEQTTDPNARRHLTRLATILTAQADRYTPTSTVDPDASPRLTAAPGPTIAAELNREDQILADLLQHPEQARTVAPWLDSAVFTTDRRRLTFELAVSIAYDGDPVDAVVLAWEVEQARPYIASPEPNQVVQPQDRPSDYAYLRRLETATVTAGTAIVVGRELLTEHVHATLAVSATAAAERALQTGPPQPVPVQAVAPTRTAEPPMSPAPVVPQPRIQL
jgi:replicative DNA helicase